MPRYRMNLTMLSPVHVGTGEEIEPTEYVVCERDKYIYFHAVDFPRFLADLDDHRRAEFNQAVDMGGTVYLRKFVNKYMDARRHVRWTANANAELLKAYREGLNSDTCQLLVNPMTRTPAGGLAYLPGSSIKGALRTAWVSRMAAQYRGRENLDRIHERDFESEVLGYRVQAGPRVRSEIRADPFRALHVGDALLCERSNTVDPVRICRRVERTGLPDPGGIQMYYDTTYSLLDDETITAVGRLTIDERLARTPVRDDPRWPFEHCVSGPIDGAELLKACNAFYRPKLEAEYQDFLAGHRDRESLGLRLLEMAKAIGQNEALIRLGRFSHFECVTVDRYRRQPRRGSGNTRSLCNGQMPLGWVKLRLDPE